MMLKRWLNYLLFAFTMFAAGAPAVGGGNADTGTGGGTGGGAGAGGGTGGQGSGDGSQPAGGAQQGGQPGDAGLKQLREAYEGVKAKFEPFEKLGIQADQITGFQTVYQKVYTEAATLGRELGFPDQEIAEALAEDPVRTIDFLRNKAAELEGQQFQQQGEQDLNELVQQHIDQAIGPIQQRENVRMTNEANSVFERTVHQAAVESFKAEGIDVANIPQDEMEMLMTATSEIMKYDADALKALKYEGKTAPIQKAFQEARTALDKYYLARAGRDKARVQSARPGQPTQQNQGGKRPTLDEMIENPGVINTKYA